jgi:hypothetical protein
MYLWGKLEKKKEFAPVVDNESIPLVIFMLYFIAITPLLGERPVLFRSRTWDFHNMQEAAEIGSPVQLIIQLYSCFAL